ncbi:uncharacterized protein PRD47_013792 [Ara ararauna]
MSRALRGETPGVVWGSTERGPGRFQSSAVGPTCAKAKPVGAGNGQKFPRGGTCREGRSVSCWGGIERAACTLCHGRRPGAAVGQRSPVCGPAGLPRGARLIRRDKEIKSSPASVSIQAALQHCHSQVPALLLSAAEHSRRFPHVELCKMMHHWRLNWLLVRSA